ncbi:MAG: hypothetical protein HRT45_04705 [Bdellovibrionales bacterium]|nr:hypothetical protein [Bdellovibrionales bacterium]
MALTAICSLVSVPSQAMVGATAGVLCSPGGPLAAVACAAPFLAMGGWLIHMPLSPKHKDHVGFDLASRSIFSGFLILNSEADPVAGLEFKQISRANASAMEISIVELSSYNSSLPLINAIYDQLNHEISTTDMGNEESVERFAELADQTGLPDDARQALKKLVASAVHAYSEQ